MRAGNDEVLRTIEAAYSAALDEDSWPNALNSLARLFDAAGATLEDFAKQPFGLRYLRVVGLPPHAETDYLAHYQRHNPRAEYAFHNLSQRVLTDYALIDERAMDHDPYYAKYLGSLDLRYFMSGQILDTRNAQAIVSIQRTRRQGHVEKGDVALMRRLLPHFSQAYDVSLRLRQATHSTRVFEQVLDWLSDGVAIVSAEGRIIHANEAFLAVARRQDGLVVRTGLLTFAGGQSGEQFAKALGAAARMRNGEHEQASTDFAAPRRDGGIPYLVSVRPLPRNGRGAASAAMVFVHDPMSRHAGLAALLRELFGFTDAEASLATALRSGVSLGDYARQRNVSMNTVYTHLRRIKDKAGAKRLADLVNRLNDLRAPLRCD